MDFFALAPLASVGVAFFLGTLVYARNSPKKSEFTLKHANEELEQRIKQRTINLQHENEQLQREINILREKERRYQLLTDTVTDVICAHDLNFRFTYFSPSVTQMLGYSEEEALNLTIDQILTPNSLKIAMETFAEELALEEKMPPKDLTRSRVLELEHIHKDSSIIWAELRSSWLRDANGQVIGVLGVTRDISARKQAEKARQELETQRAKFISMTTHELRTPLTAIRGFSEILEHQLERLSSEQKRQCFEIIGRNVHRLERLITGVSTLGQLERGTFHLDKKEVNFYNLILEALQPYRASLGAQLEFDYNSKEPMWVNGDAVRLSQILDNLLENAIKHTPQNGRKIRVTLEIQSKSVFVQISDNGAGIALDDLNRIFEPFVTIPTQYSTRGTGIGLHISRLLAEAHGGTLIARSSGKGHGSTFILSLPIKKTS